MLDIIEKRIEKQTTEKGFCARLSEFLFEATPEDSVMCPYKLHVYEDEEEKTSGGGTWDREMGQSGHSGI